MDTVSDFKARLDQITDGYDEKNIFNSDETGLLFRTLPDKSLARKKSECKGGKMAKERLTVMLCWSMSGEKLKPMVIGKARKPRCFKNIDIEKLPVVWRSNKKSWMTECTFLDWVKGVNRKMKREKRKILLFLDNVTSHSKDIPFSIGLGLGLGLDVTLNFFPASCTFKLQPLDLGIIRAFKDRYRKLMMSHLISNIEQCENVTELTKKISVLQAVNWISQSWKKLKIRQL